MGLNNRPVSNVLRSRRELRFWGLNSINICTMKIESRSNVLASCLGKNTLSIFCSLRQDVKVLCFKLVMKVYNRWPGKNPKDCSIISNNVQLSIEGELGQECNWIEFHAIAPLTPFHWIIHHSIRQHTSCHWMGLHFIRSYVILTYHIFYVIGLGFMSLQRIILPENHICVIESKFMSLDRRPFDGTTSCHCIELHVIGSETSFHRASSLLKKRLSPRMLFRLFSARLFFIGGVLLCEKCGLRWTT